MKQRGIERHGRRRDEQKAHLIAPHRHDPYKARHKPRNPSLCPGCGAVFMAGRWRWELPEDGGEIAGRETCPACQRIADHFPAGEVTLAGDFPAAHREELLALVRATETQEKREHPLGRIMEIEEADGRIVIRTTDIHLPRRIGHALTGAYKGELATHYDEAGHFVRVAWTRGG